MRYLHNSAWGLLLLLCAVFLLRGSLIGSALTNASLVTLVKSSLCNNGDLTCHPYPWQEDNQAQGERVKKWLEAALKWQPNSTAIRLHLATVLFGLGLHNEAAKMAAPLGSYPAGRSPLVPVGLPREQYEYHLVNAQQMAMAGHWAEAIRDFRLGLAWGGDLTLPIDQQGFYEAQVNFYREQAQADPADARMSYLTGKYLLKVGKWSEALLWLEQATAISGAGRLIPDDAGRAFMNIGQSLEAQGDLEGARNAYDQAVSDSPNLREAYVYMIHLLKAQGDPSTADRIASHLAAMGPGTLLGRQASNYQVSNPVTLPDGWMLVGYDLDEESLESGGQIEILLWWQKPDNSHVKGEVWTQAGPYWLEWRMVTNLFPNAGFEWGTRPDGIPLGLNGGLYGAASRLAVKPVIRNGSDSQALFANNAAKNLNVALEGYSSQANSTEYYLMAGWIWNEARNGLIGRSCDGKGSGGIYYIGGDLQEPTFAWVHEADLNVAQPGRQDVKNCSVLLMNYNTKSTAAWDDILWVPISSP